MPTKPTVFITWPVKSRSAQGQERDRLVWGLLGASRCVRGSTQIRAFHPQIFLQREDLWSSILGKKRLSEASPPHTCGSQWGWNCPQRAFGESTGACGGHGWHLEGGQGRGACRAQEEGVPVSSTANPESQQHTLVRTVADIAGGAWRGPISLKGKTCRRGSAACCLMHPGEACGHCISLSPSEHSAT